MSGPIPLSELKERGFVNKRGDLVFSEPHNSDLFSASSSSLHSLSTKPIRQPSASSSSSSFESNFSAFNSSGNLSTVTARIQAVQVQKYRIHGEPKAELHVENLIDGGIRMTLESKEDVIMVQRCNRARSFAFSIR